jgi:hypothetical protein
VSITKQNLNKMQYDFLEHKWGLGPIPEWVDEAFNNFMMWFSVGNMHRQVGVRTPEGIKFAEQGDWLQSLPNGTYGVRHAEQ